MGKAAQHMNGYASPPETFQVTGESTAPMTIIAGYTHCLPDWSLQSHAHDRIELQLVTSGRFLYSTDNDTYRLDAGDICLTKPGEVHNMRADYDGNSQVIHLLLDSIRPREVEFVFQKTKVRIIRSRSELIPVLQAVLAELRQPGPLCRVLVSSLVCQFLIYVSRQIWHTEEFSASPQYARDEIIVHALWYLQHNCRHGITVDEVAREIGISKSSLAHRFAKEVNEPICRYNHRLVMQRARWLIEEGHLRIHEIAELLGYPSVNYFSTVFKKHFGYPPSKYELQCAHNPDEIT
ncbi:MAG: helix-turn-helix transcriptional regulator [Armatimonadota bacterium]